MKNLSIIIPCYNAGETIERLIVSILKCDNIDFEVIIVNDGSTDDTLNKCKSFKDNRIKIMTVKNGGAAKARNIGIRASTARYIMFADSDDYMVDGWWHPIKRIIESKKEKDIVIFGVHIGEKATDKADVVRKIFIQDKNVCYYRLVTSKLYKRDFLSKNNIRFTTGLINGEDMLFNIAAISKANSFEEVNESTYAYGINLLSATHKFDKKIFGNQTNILNEINKNSLTKQYHDPYREETVKMLCCRMAYSDYDLIKDKYVNVLPFCRGNNISIRTRILGLLIVLRLTKIIYVVNRYKNKRKTSGIFEVI